MGDDRKPRGADLTPEQRQKIEAVKAANRTPEARARQATTRARFADKPGLAELIRRGDVEPDRITTMGALGAMHKALAAARRAREAKGLSLSEVAARSGMPLPALSRLEGGKNPNFTFETLARYAAAVGLDLDVVVRDREAPSLGTGVEEQDRPSDDPGEVISLIASELGDFLKRLHTRVDALHVASGSSPPNVANPPGPGAGPEPSPTTNDSSPSEPFEQVGRDPLDARIGASRL